jgi:hypothetical protein
MEKLDEPIISLYLYENAIHRADVGMPVVYRGWKPGLRKRVQE